MDGLTDISTITDITLLKAMAYDQVVAQEQARANLVAINQRLNQISSTTQEPIDE